MKKCILLLASLFLTLLVFQAAADKPAKEVSSEPAAAAVAPAPDSAADQAGTCDELLPEPTPLSDPQPANSCVPSQCRQDCKAGCSPGCICSGSCATGFCECTETCF